MSIKSRKASAGEENEIKWLPIHKNESELFEKVGFRFPDGFYNDARCGSYAKTVQYPPGWGCSLDTINSEPRDWTFYNLTDQFGAIRGRYKEFGGHELTLYSRLSLRYTGLNSLMDNVSAVELHDGATDRTFIDNFARLVLNTSPDDPNKIKRVGVSFNVGKFDVYQDALAFIERPDVQAAFEKAFPRHDAPLAYWDDLDLSRKAEAFRENLVEIVSMASMEKALQRGTLLQARKGPKDGPAS